MCVCLSALMQSKEKAIKLRHDVVDGRVEKSTGTVVISREDGACKVFVFCFGRLVFDGPVRRRVRLIGFLLVKDRLI